MVILIKDDEVLHVLSAQILVFLFYLSVEFKLYNLVYKIFNEKNTDFFIGIDLTKI